MARTNLDCRLECYMPELDLPDEHATALFRLFQETLTNIARHAQATRVEAVFELRADHLCLTVSDNGRGIADAEIRNPASLGLLGMRERVHLLSGDIQVEGRPGRGTAVTIRVPYPVRDTTLPV
jgi:signal transduction histidine kinase